MLTKQPFEPMLKANLKHSTLKTVFLLALASGKRRGELHALRKDILHTEHWASVTILPDPNFVAKTQLNSKGAQALNMVTIKALTKDLGTDMQEDRSLCVVRALRYYLDQTESIRKGRKKLFIAHKKGYKEDQEIHMNTISGWIKKTILMAYESASEEDLQFSQVKAHQVRAMASSWALYSNASMEDIMTACSWRNASTFTRFYLKDLTLIRDRMHHLGPVVAAWHSS
jgi:integrase